MKKSLWCLFLSTLVVAIFMFVTAIVTGQKMLEELEKQAVVEVEPEYDRSLTPEQQLMEDISKMHILKVHEFSIDTKVLEAPEAEVVPEESVEVQAPAPAPDPVPAPAPKPAPELDFDLVPGEIAGGELRYNATESEREFLVFTTFAEAANQGFWGQVFVADVPINIALKDGKDLIYVLTHYGFSPVKNGVPTYWNSEKKKRVPVTWDVIPQEVIDAVDLALRQDYTEELLKKVADEKGLDSSYYEGGALFFDNPDLITQQQRDARSQIKVRFKYRDQEFFRIWDPNK